MLLFVCNYLERRAGSCNTLNDVSNGVYVLDETEYLNLLVFDMVTEINRSGTLTKHTSCKWESKFDSKKL